MFFMGDLNASVGNDIIPGTKEWYNENWDLSIKGPM